MKEKDLFKLVIVGHVDHGKSTLLGRLLADTGSLPEGKLESVQERCKRNSKPFEYAFLIDALKDEVSQGITIDSARIFFSTVKRSYLILDAPGHIEFLKNMVTGASHAHAALLVIDAGEGVAENSRRHATLLSMLGVKQIAVVINKMDLVAYKECVFQSLSQEFTEFLRELDMEPRAFVPVSAMQGDGICSHSDEMPWYQGPTVLETLDKFQGLPTRQKDFLRMNVQDIYKFTNFGDNRRIIAGRVDSGQLQPGDEVVFHPSLKKGKVKTIENFPRGRKIKQVRAGDSCGFTLEEQIYVKRGEIVSKLKEDNPAHGREFLANVFWLGKTPLVPKREYTLKLGSQKVSCRVLAIEKVVDASNLKVEENSTEVRKNATATVVIKTRYPLACDFARSGRETSRFVLVDQYDIAGGGIVLESVDEEQHWVREKLEIRQKRWEYSSISNRERAERNGHKGVLVVVTGERDVGKKPFARYVERNFFQEGRQIYFLGIGNVLYGVDADIKSQEDHRFEHLRRVAEVCNLMVESGQIVLLTAISLKQGEIELFQTLLGNDRVMSCWLGPRSPGSPGCDLHLDPEDQESAFLELRDRLRKMGFLAAFFDDW